MKKLFTFLGALLLMFGYGLRGEAQTYTPSYTGNSTHSDRYTNYIRLETSAGEQTIETTQTGTRQTVWKDRTSEKFTCFVGETVTPKFAYNGSWMHGYCFVDENKNGFQFNSATDIINHVLQTGSGIDLKSFSYLGGYLPNGTSIAEGDAENLSVLPSFVAPSTSGTYRMRYMVAWDNANPAGYSGITTNGGLICDVMLEVMELTGLVIGSHDLYIGSGETGQILAEAPNAITYTSSNPTVASVNASGLVTVHSGFKGKVDVTITITSGSETGTVTVHCDSYGVSVSNGAEPGTPRYLTSVTTTGAETNLNYTGGTDPGATHYKDATDHLLKVKPGQAITLTFVGSGGSDGMRYTKGMAWIDYDCNGVFSEESERVFTEGANDAPTANFETGHSVSFTIPETATTGQSRLRMVFANAWSDGRNTLHPTGQTQKGFTIDFDVEIFTDMPIPEPPTTTGDAITTLYLKKGETYLGITNAITSNGINNVATPQRWKVTESGGSVALHNLDAGNRKNYSWLYNGSSFSINEETQSVVNKIYFQAYLIDTATGYGWPVNEFYAGSTYALVGKNYDKAMDNVLVSDTSGEQYNKFMGVNYTAASGTTPARFPESSWWTVEAPPLTITLNYTDENGTVTSVTKEANAGTSVATLAAPYEGYTLGECEPATVVAGTTAYTVHCVRQLTFTYRDELGNEFVTSAAGTAYLNGATIPTTFDFYTLNEDETETTTVNTTTANYVIRLDNNFPFKVCPAPSETTGWDTETAHSADYWYLLNTPTQYQNGAVYIPTRFMFRESSTRVRSNAFSRELNENYLWAFVKVNGTQNHFRLYNLGEEASHDMASAGYYLRKQPSVDETTFDSTSTGVSEFIVKKSTNANNPKAFVMQDPNRENAHLGRHTGGWDPDKNPTFGFWADNSSATDEGSQLYVTPVVQLTDFDMDDTYSAEDGYVGAYLNSSNETTTACDTYKTNYKLADLRTLIATVGSDTDNARVEIAPNKYYQLISYNDVNCEGMVAYSNAYRNADATSYGDRALLLCSQTDVSVPASAIQFVAEGTTGTYDIQHANSGFWFADLSQLSNGAIADLPVSQPGDGIGYYLNNEGGMVNVWSLHCTTSNAKYFHCGAGPINGVSTAICSEDTPATNDGMLWLIKEIKDVEVTIGSAEWNSVCFPMPVVVPAEGCEVYVGQQIETNDYMTLTQLAAGTVIPEGTGFLVTGEAGAKAKFVVSETAGTAIDNLLEGVKARRSGMTAGEFYGLGQKSGKVGFYKSQTTFVPANKAYLPAANVPTGSGTQGIRLDKDGVTGIAPATLTEPMATRYFDLQGRPVLFPAHGVYVTEDGKKVFIK